MQSRPITESAASLIQAAQAAFHQGRHDEAVELLRRALACREDPGVLSDLAVALSQSGRFRLGLVWKAGGTQQNDQRSLRDLAALAPLWAVSGVTFISFQKGRGEDEASAGIPGHALVHVGSELGDFADTAAALSLLDLLITVDTGFAHLSGALGRPTWILLPARGVDWQAVIATVVSALSAEIRARGPGDQGFTRTGDDRGHAVQNE